MNFNILDEYVFYIEKNLKIISKLTLNKYFSSKEFNELFDTYKKVRYYDIFESKKNSFKDNVDYYLKNKIANLKIDNELNEKSVLTLEMLLDIFLLDYDKNLKIDKYISNLSEK